MFAHVHATGAVYFAHAGAWYNLQIVDDLGSGGGSGDTFKTIVSDDGPNHCDPEFKTNVELGVPNIATAIATDTPDVTINLSSLVVGFFKRCRYNNNSIH